MTLDQFQKRSFKAYQAINFVNPKTGNIVECMLIGINYDAGVMFMRPIPISEYEPLDLPVSYQYAELPTPQLKVSKKL